MSVPAVYLPAAEDDIAAAFASYEQQRPGLGDDFAAAVRDLVDRICVSPQLYGVFRRGVRAAPLRRFPYVLYYRDRTSDVLIVAVQHGRRSSRRWSDRV